jgi:hypothetical protein
MGSSEVRRFELSAWNAIVGLGTGERFVRASDYDALAAELASQVAWKERYMREVLEAAERIRELEAALARAKELVYRPFPMPLVIDTYTTFYVEWCTDRERIFATVDRTGEP